MKLLVVSPDYASHALPLIEIGAAWARAHGEAIVATGHATRPLVERAGLEWTELRLGRGSNAGVITADEQPPGEDAHLHAFFDATRLGPAATLAYQALARRHDLLYEPDAVIERLATVIATVRPDRVVVDHVAFGARLALHALGVASATAVLGHPSALPAADGVFGLPDRWPSGMTPSSADLAELRTLCNAAAVELTTVGNEVLRRCAPDRSLIGDLTQSAGCPTIYAYPSALHTTGAPNAVFVGSLGRTETADGIELPRGDGPRVTVALGSFLSARGDVLAAAVCAARRDGWRLALAHGSTPLSELGTLPDGAVVKRHLPQVALLQHTDVFVNHGGNGSITEAAAAGVPMVVLPFSTDQFAGAAAVERFELGVALAPNNLTPEALVDAVRRTVGHEVRGRARAIAVTVAADGGARRAASAIAG